VVLRQQGEDGGCGPRGEVVEGVEGQGADDEGEEERREEGRVGEGCEEECLHHPHINQYACLYIYILSVDTRGDKGKEAYGSFPPTPHPLHHP